MGKNLKLYALIIASMTVPLSFFYAYAEKGPLSIDTEASCITASCHAGMGKKRYVHVAGVDAKQCKRCHEIIKQGEHSFKKVPSETFPLCVKCHSEEFAPPEDIKGTPPKVILKDKELKLHKPFAEGKCTECHDAHESDFYKHLKAEYPQGLYASFSAGQYSLCLKCHKEILKAFTEARTLTDTGFRNGNLSLHFRHVNMLKGRTCQACHHHHGSKKPKLIRDTFVFGKKALTVNFEKTATGGSCGPACHINIKYDRYEPVKHLMKTTPVPGNDATEEE
ncbi:MAG: cytochrome c3 family protein, partial [Nitrospirae bacterium]|nr:cytochrome c3 family protein [Nitrospirota bacterium]